MRANTGPHAKCYLISCQLRAVALYDHWAGSPANRAGAPGNPAARCRRGSASSARLRCRRAAWPRPVALKGPFSGVSRKNSRVIKFLVYNSTRSGCSRIANPAFRSLLLMDRPRKSCFGLHDQRRGGDERRERVHADVPRLAESAMRSEQDSDSGVHENVEL